MPVLIEYPSFIQQDTEPAPAVLHEVQTTSIELPELITKDQLSAPTTEKLQVERSIREPEDIDIPIAPVEELLSFISVLQLPEDAAMSVDNLEAIPSSEILTLPPICAEVTKAVADLEIKLPEAAEGAKDLLVSIVQAIDEVVRLRIDGSSLAPYAEEQLHDLCIELFTRLELPCTNETVMEFVQGIMTTKHLLQLATDTSAVPTEKGTHEIKQEHDPIFGGMLQHFEDYVARAIGTQALHSTSLTIVS